MILADSADGGSGGSGFPTIIFLVLLVALFYFLIIRPARNRQRHALAVQSQVHPGVEVVTSAGLYGTVQSVEDGVVVLEVAPGVTNRYALQAIMRVLTPDVEPEPEAPIDEPDEK